MQLWTRDFNRRFNEILAAYNFNMSNRGAITYILKRLDIKEGSIRGLQVEVMSNWEKKLKQILRGDK